MTFNAHEKPPETFKSLFKKYQKLSIDAVDRDRDVVDFDRGLLAHQQPAFSTKAWIESHNLIEASKVYCQKFEDVTQDQAGRVTCFEAKDIPGGSMAWTGQVCKRCLPLAGLIVVPRLIPLEVQQSVLDRTFHRDLSNPAHKTNVHFHHGIEYPASHASFFDSNPSSFSYFSPYDSSIHKPLNVQQFLNKKLRWMTLGGQYDWTRKQYPDEAPPAFPKDLQQLLHNLFPDTVAEAAIVNLYSPGDVLSLHRDVSEYCDQGLVSVSVGCDGLFMIALGDDKDDRAPLRQLILRLRSGDAVYMTGESRYAWHGVPLVLPNTCPEQLKSWPCNEKIIEDHDEGDRFEQWRDWLANKRINLNVRQMFAHEPSGDVDNG